MAIPSLQQGKCKPRLKVGEGIDLVGTGIGTQTTALEQGLDPTSQAPHKPGDRGIIWWRQRMEAGMPGGALSS